MQAIQVSEFGGIDVLKLVELPDPVPGRGQVVVNVKASGVNYAETRMRSGAFASVGIPFVIGMESAGVVAAVGEGVAGFAPGDRVFGRARGSHAEQVVFDAVHLLRLPDNLSFIEGAAIPVGWLTAWHSLITVADLQPGRKVLLEAAASSVGSAALQIAKWRGCWVAGTASRDEKVQRTLAAGADAAYNYQTEDVPARVLADTGNKGADVAMVCIGEETAAQTIAAMGNEGKLILYGSTGGMKYGFDLRAANRNLQFLSISIITSPRFLPESMQTFRAQALPLFAAGVFKAVVDTVLPLAQVGAAHRMIEERRHFGKVVLTME